LAVTQIEGITVAVAVDSHKKAPLPAIFDIHDSVPGNQIEYRIQIVPDVPVPWSELKSTRHPPEFPSGLGIENKQETREVRVVSGSHTNSLCCCGHRQDKKND